MRLFGWLMVLVLFACTVPAVSADAVAPADTTATVAVQESALPASSTATTPAEVELGKKTEEQFIKAGYKFVKDEKTIKKLNDMAVKIAPFTERPDVVYQCKILDIGELNAMATPGGNIYFTKGILAAVESDDELAGVMAHEIAHNSLYHAKKMMAREARASILQVASIVASLYANSDSVSPMQMITMSELIKQALLNGYSVEMEIEADQHGVDYLYKLKEYDPIGLYSVILGFNKIAQGSVEENLGYLKTHPYSDERKRLIEKHLKDLGIPINLWRVVGFRAQVVPPAEDQKGYTVRLGAVDVVTLTESHTGLDAKSRATDAADAMNRRIMKDAIQQVDIRIDSQDGRSTIYFRSYPVLTLTTDDAEAAGMSLDALASLARQNIRDSIWRETVKRW